MIFTYLLVLVLAQPTPAAVPSGGEQLVGAVVDTTGKPLAGADVWLASGLPPSGERPLIGGVLWMQSSRPSLGESNAALKHTRTDQEGQFRVELPAEIVRSQEPLAVGLWAHVAGARTASRRLRWALPAPAAPIRLVVEKSTQAGFRLLGPDGAPVADARIAASAVEGMVVPGELAEKVAGTVGPDGAAALPDFAPGAIRWVRVDSPKFGTQLIRTLGARTTPASAFRLEPVGRVSGRVVAESDQPVNALRVQAETFPAGYDLGGTIGSATVTTDANGRFEIPAIAAGRLSLVLDLRSRSDLPYRGLPPASQVVEAGQTTTLEIRLNRAVHLEGIIRERGTGIPIAGVSPQIPDLAVRLGGNPAVVTDANGKFEGYIEGQQPYAFIYSTPKPYYIPETPDTFHLLPAGATEFKLPPIELVRGASLRGSVVDEAGKYVPGALVRASWGGDRTMLQSVAVRTDSSGRFLLEGLDPLADLRITAESDGRSSGSAQTARAGPDKEAKLEVKRSNNVLLAGRVLDSSQKAVAGADVRLRSQTRGSKGQVWRTDVVVFADQNVLHTDQNGRFQTPIGVPAGLEYEAAITAPDTTPGRTGWIKTGGSAAREFPELVLHRIRAVDGVVRDREGRLVAGATVSQSGDGPMRTRTVTDVQGRFRLSGMIAGKVILFVRKDGFRFQGQPIDTEAGAAELVVSRVDESQTMLKTLASAVPHQEELALARRLLAPYVEAVVSRGSDGQKFQTLVAHAQVDPAHALELLDSHSAGKPQFAVDALRAAVATAMAGQSPDESLTVAQSIHESGARAWCLTGLAEKLPASARERKAELLTQAQLQARAVKQPAERIVLFARLAERWLDLGEKERATALFDEGRALAKEVPPPGYQVAMFAQSLARVDCPGALSLVEQSKGLAKRGDRVNRVFVFDRAYGEIAYRVASNNPGAAERVLGLIVDSHRRGGYVAAASMRIALNDLARGRRLVETIEDPKIGAYGLGQMARALAATDKSSAIRLLDEAFDRLEKYRDDRRGYASSDSVAGALLEAVEAVAPARLQEFLWRAVSLRAPLLDERGEGSSERSAAELALTLARYDRAAAMAVLARALDSFRKTDTDGFRQGFIARSLALIDPARVVSVVESLPDEAGLDRSLPKNCARIFAAEILAKEAEDRWRTARDSAVSLWKPEGSDL
jgi:hypothetical protein